VTKHIFFSLPQDFFLTPRKKILAVRKKMVARKNLEARKKNVCHYTKKPFSWYQKSFLREIGD